MRRVDFEIFKYPRRPRFSISASLLRDEPDALMLYVPAGRELYSHQEQTSRKASHHIIGFFWPGRYYNAEIFWKPDWTFKGYYVNLALPVEWDGQRCAYVDLELDLSHYVGEPIKLLDEDEYEESKLKYNFPPELIEQVEVAKAGAMHLLEAKFFPFDDSLVTWRPSPEDVV